MHIGYDIDPSKTFNLDIPNELQQIGHEKILSVLENNKRVTFEYKNDKINYDKKSGRINH